MYTTPQCDRDHWPESKFQLFISAGALLKGPTSRGTERLVTTITAAAAAALSYPLLHVSDHNELKAAAPTSNTNTRH